MVDEAHILPGKGLRGQEGEITPMVRLADVVAEVLSIDRQIQTRVVSEKALKVARRTSY